MSGDTSTLPPPPFEKDSYDFESMCFSSAEGAARAFFFAQRAWTAFRAAALRSSALRPAQRALPPCDWIACRCSRNVNSAFFFMLGIIRTAARNEVQGKPTRLIPDGLCPCKYMRK